MDEKKALSGQLSAEEITALKEKHGDIFALKVDDKIGYLKKVDRKILSYASTAGTKDPMKFNEIILANCWIGGDEELKTNDDYFLGASAVISQLITIKEAELEKL